jgi:hypothetical protein
MEFLLLRSHNETPDDDQEEAAATGSLAVATNIYEELGEISISAIRLKRKLPGWLSTNNRVFHAVNGQVQFKQTRGYLSQTCGLPALKDRVIVIVDASNLTYEAHNEVWKGDREHVRDTIIGERYKDVVTAAIKESQALNALQREIAQEELEQAAKSQRNELFQKLVNTDRHLASLLTDRDPKVKLPSAGGGKTGAHARVGTFEGKYSPTFLRLEGKTKEKGITVPVNRTRPVSARTDAENGYLQRADNRGRLFIEPSPTKWFGIRTQLHDGRLTIYFEPATDTLRIGDTLTFTIGLQDESMPRPVNDVLTIRIADEEKEPKKEKKKSQPHVSDQGSKEGEGRDLPIRGLPQYRLLTKDGRSVDDQETETWPEGFSELDGGIIEER